MYNFKKKIIRETKSALFKDFQTRMKLTVGGKQIFSQLESKQFEPTDGPQDAILAVYKTLKPRQTAADLIPHYPGNFRSKPKKRKGEVMIFKSSTEFRDELKRIKLLHEQEEIEKEERKRLRVEKTKEMEAEKERKILLKQARAKKMLDKKKLDEERKKMRLEAAQLKKIQKLTSEPKKRGRKKKDPPKKVDVIEEDEELYDVSTFI